MKKTKYLILALVAVLGLIWTGWLYFAPNAGSYVSGRVVAVKTSLAQKTTDEYQNKDQRMDQRLTVQTAQGVKHFDNSYVASQILTQKYRRNDRVLLAHHGGRLVGLRRDWVVALALTIFACLLIFVTEKRSLFLAFSLVLNCLLFYGAIRLDIVENGTRIFTIYGLACLLFSLFSLLLAQGPSTKMLATLLATCLSTILAFVICCGIMRLTHESGIKYESVEFATQSPRSIFLAQTMLGLLGAVMDEATDIIASLSSLMQEDPALSKKQFWHAGLEIGREIMGPLINVLVLIFMAEALPMTILYLRDNNTLAYTFQFGLSLGILQSLVSAIGIVLNIPVAALCSLLFYKNKKEVAA